MDEYFGAPTNPAFDPIPIPINTAPPNQWIPVSDGRPWHCQIHRDAFAYGDHPPNVDDRLIVDLRWFGIVGQHASNRVSFDECAARGIVDVMGLPQPTFNFSYTREERARLHAMMAVRRGWGGSCCDQLSPWVGHRPGEHIQHHRRAGGRAGTGRGGEGRVAAGQ